MKTIKLPAIEKIRKHSDYYTSLLNPINDQKEILNYLKYNNNLIKPQANDNLSSLLFSPLQYLKKYRRNRFGYLVSKTKIPQISMIHSKIIQESLMKQQNNCLSKENSKTDLLIENQAQFEYPTIIKDPNRFFRDIDIIGESKVEGEKEIEQYRSPLYNNYYKKKKIITDPYIGELISDELFKAKKHVYNRSGSQSTLTNKSNNAKLIFDKVNRLNSINEKTNSNNSKNNKNMKVNKHIKSMDWTFIDINLTNTIIPNKIEIAKYENPYRVIQNDALIKKIYEETMAYIPKK